MKKEIKQYGTLRLTELLADTWQETQGISGQCIRVELPADPANVVHMLGLGYTYGDRTLGVTINLKRCRQDYQKLIRFEMKLADAAALEDIRRIAFASFPYDRRFHVRPLPDQEIAEEVLSAWIDGLNNPYVCRYKDRTIGFIDLEEIDDETCFVHLAAVEEKYRASGCAVSMYAWAMQYAEQHGFKKLAGRVSTMNTAVMNLYSFLGANYSDAKDVYLKEEGMYHA